MVAPSANPLFSCKTRQTDDTADDDTDDSGVISWESISADISYA